MPREVPHRLLYGSRRVTTNANYLLDERAAVVRELAALREHEDAEEEVAGGLLSTILEGPRGG